MPLTFNPPPTWPPAPNGWVPPPGWQPDPRWGAPPPGWPLWKRANPSAFGRTFTVAGVFYALMLVLALSSGRVAKPAEAVGYGIGQVLISGLIAGIFPFRSRTRWGWGLCIAMTLGVAIALALVQAYSARNSS